MQDIVVVGSKTYRGRFILIAAVLFGLVTAWFAMRWQLGNMLAELTPPSDPNALDISALAMNLAPADPSANWLRAVTGSNDATQDTGSSTRIYENAVRLSPFDYRWRVEFGRALEQDEQTESAEIELKKAIELAPTYAQPHWTLGNFYLRRERNDEAVAEFKLAAENNEIYRDQVFSLAWDFFGKDPAMVEAMAGDRPEARARLAYFFAARGRASEALRNWNLLSDQEKQANPVIAKSMAHGLFVQGFFPQALEFSRQLGFDSDAVPETITDGSFERGVVESGESRFGWQVVRNDPKIEIASDSRVKRDGSRSLRVAFRNFVRPELYNIFQTVVVIPNKSYRLQFWVRTENLKGTEMPLVEIVNANDNKVIARSQPISSGTNEWQRISIDFAAPENCSGVTVRTIRFACGDGCPISGMFWYDDFEFVRQ